MKPETVRRAAEILYEDVGEESWLVILKVLDREVCSIAMDRHNNCGWKASRYLNIQRCTLVEKRKRYGLKMHKNPWESRKKPIQQEEDKK